MGGRGQMTLNPERNDIISYMKDGTSKGARKEQICKIIGINIRTIQRWEKNQGGDRRPDSKHKSPIALSEKEKDSIIKICTSDEYKDMNPNVIVPLLAEKGIYIASESSFYRVLRERGLLNHRSECKPPKPRKAPDELKATGPRQVFSWDITYLKTKIRGIFFYLYLFMDVWSRKIVGWTVEEFEDGNVASSVISEICKQEKIDSVYLHSDNGGPMTCATMLGTLQRLGVVPSFSRARVSNDNAYSESLFKTLKYVPAYPGQFNSIEEASKWVETFVEWYNTKHRHSGIKYVTPNERHLKADIEIMKKRKRTYIAARKKNPGRWSKNIRNWDYIEEVILNKRKENIKMLKAA